MGVFKADLKLIFNTQMIRRAIKILTFSPSIFKKVMTFITQASTSRLREPLGRGY